MAIVYEFPDEDKLAYKPSGTHEENLEWIRVDNGAKDKRDWWRHAFNVTKKPARQVCGAKLRPGNGNRNVYYAVDTETGERTEKRRRCTQFNALYPNGRCYRHGGKLPGAHLVSGFYSRRQIGPLARATENAQDRKRVLDLGPQIALFDLRIAELSNRIEEEGDTPEFRRQADRLFRNLQEAQKDGDDELVKTITKNLGRLLRTGVKSDAAWDSILKTADLRNKRAEKANEIYIKGHQVVSKEEMLWVLARILDIIDAETDTGSAGRIQQRVYREIVARVDPETRRPSEEIVRAPILRVSGSGGGVPEGGAGGEALGVPARGDGEPLQAREVFCEDSPRGGEDEGGGIDRADLPDDEGGLDRHLNGADQGPDQEPAVGNDRAAPLESAADSPW